MSIGTPAVGAVRHESADGIGWITISNPCVPTPKEQEIVSKYGSMHKYEGSSAVTGTLLDKAVSGHCMIELSGPWM
jgi:hypothetical protein